jgi:hypothetical protein
MNLLYEVVFLSYWIPAFWKQDYTFPKETILNEEKGINMNTFIASYN